MLENNTSNFEKNSDDNDEILDISNLIHLLLRNKKLISLITLISLLLGFIYSYTKKEVWKGEFEIVISDKQSSELNSLPNSSLLTAFTQLSRSGRKKLLTEVEILKSSSVLMPIFNYVKENYTAKLKKESDLKFNNWVNNQLNVKLIKGTTVLKLHYLDKEKDLIIPVLNKISNTYQKYSKKDRSLGIKNGIKYLENQISFYRDKSLKSSLSSQTYAIEQNLTSLGSEYNLISKNRTNKNYKTKNSKDLRMTPSIDYEIFSKTNIEVIRIDAANKINLIDEKIKAVKNIDQDTNSLLFIVPELETTTIKNLINIDRKLALAKTIYKKNDKKITDLNSIKKELTNVLKKQINGYLTSQKAIAEATLSSTDRSPMVLTKYRELRKEAYMDQEILAGLERNLKELSLEEAKAENPWQLISKPTLYDEPVEPKKGLILLSSILVGLIFGVITSVYLDNQKDLIYNSKQLKKFSNFPIIKEFKKNDKKLLEDNLKLIFESNFLEEFQNVEVLILGKFNSSLGENFIEQLSRFFDKNKFIYKIDEIKNTSNLICIGELGSFTKNDINLLSENIKFNKKNIIGWILI